MRKKHTDVFRDALFRATNRNDEPRVKSLLGKGADPNRWLGSRTDKCNPLEAALYAQADRVVAHLLQSGANPNKTLRGFTPLMIACDLQRLDFVELLLKAGADPNIRCSASQKEYRGRTALISAAERGASEIVLRLLVAGADPSCKTAAGRNAVTEAAAIGNLALVRTLVAAGCPVIGNSILAAVMQGGSLPVLKFLLKVGGNLNHTDEGSIMAKTKGVTPLGHAIQFRRDDLALELIEAGANPNLPSWGVLPICSAAFQGEVKVVKALLGAGANLEAMNPADYTPLGSAAERGHVDVAKLLLKAGANPNGKGPRGKTPVELAQERGHENVLRLLLARGGRAEKRCSEGEAPDSLNE